MPVGGNGDSGPTTVKTSKGREQAQDAHFLAPALCKPALHTHHHKLTYSRAQGLPPTPASNALGHLCNPHVVWASCPGWRLPTARSLGTALALGGDPGNQGLKRDGQPALTAPANNGHACRGPAPDWECGREGRSGVGLVWRLLQQGGRNSGGVEESGLPSARSRLRRGLAACGLGCAPTKPLLCSASVSPPAPWSGACLRGQS